MRKITFYFSLCFVLVMTFANAQNSEKITRVLEYKPAPGQHINRLFPTPAYSDSPENALAFAASCLVDNKSMLGLGAYGGYVVVGFDHTIVNVPDAFDFKALGNAYTNNAEPGIVMVCQDLNKNGVPDQNEPWYELAGSEHKNAQTIHNYKITYYRPNPDGQKSNIVWKDNKGNNGAVTHISFASQVTMYPLWIAEDSMTFRGTRLPGNGVQNGSTWTLPAFDWGYADNQSNASADDKIGFDIDWAVDDSGNPVRLDYIDFIKVYTGVVQEAGWLGETSTELAGIVDLNPQAIGVNYPPVGEKYSTLDLQNTTTLASGPLALNTHWDDTYAENVQLESQQFIFSHRNGWGGTYWDGFTMSNHADNADYPGNWPSNQWGSMPKGGVNGEGTNFLIAYWDAYGDAYKTNVTESSNYVKFTDGKNYKPVGMYVTNAPWSYYSCLNGDAFTRKFKEGDYFKLIATGYAADSTTTTGTTEFYLADYRSVNPIQWKLHNTWQWMDLTSLGEVSFIRFTMESTDKGDWGINTPTLFCMDKLTVEKTNTSSTDNNVALNGAYRSGNKLYNLPQGEQIKIFRLNGTLYYEGKIQASEMEIPSGELFIIKLQSKDNIRIIR